MSDGDSWCNCVVYGSIEQIGVRINQACYSQVNYTLDTTNIVNSLYINHIYDYTPNLEKFW